MCFDWMMPEECGEECFFKYLARSNLLVRIEIMRSAIETRGDIIRDQLGPSTSVCAHKNCASNYVNSNRRRKEKVAETS